VAGSGVEVVGRVIFPDHHRFHSDELADVAVGARAAHADAIVTTTKDAVRLESLRHGELGLPLLALDVAAVIRDETRFRNRLLTAVGRPA
jgi:tetraacyldisaccharide-1-P 4'-kinase